MSNGESSDGMRSIGAQLRDTNDCNINPATEDTLSDINDSLTSAKETTSDSNKFDMAQSDLYTTFKDMLQEMKKTNLYLQLLTDHEIKNTEIE